MPDQTPTPQSVTMVDPGTGRAADVPLDQINAYQDQGFTLETPDERAGRLSAEARASIYGGAKGALLAGTAGVLRGATLGGSDVAARALEGEDAAIALQGYREAHPGISFASELGGAVLPSLVSGGAAAPAGAAAAIGRGTATAVGGGLRGALAGGAVEGALFGAGQGVSELALSRDPLTLEHAAAAIGSNALYGAGVGALAGGAFKGVEIGLGKARAVVQDFADRQAAAQDLVHAGAVVGEDLAGLDTKGLRAARDTELDRIAQEQATQRTAARSSAVDDLLAYRQTVKDANPWLVIIEGEPSKQLSKANNAIRAALDDPNGLRESPGSLLKPLRIEEQALQNAVENRATIAAKLDEVNAKIAADLDKQLPVAAPAAPPVEPPAAARGRIEVNDIGGQRMRATMPDGSTVDLGTSGADAFLEQQMPAGFHPAKIETYRPFAIEHGLPGTAADVAKLEDNAIYIARPSELIKRDLWGNELKEANRDSILSAWKEGKTLKPIDGWVTPEGRLYVEDGNHRIQAAARDGDRPVAIRFRDGTNYDPQRSARAIGDRIRADLPKSGESVPSTAAPTTWREFQASKMGEYMRSEGGHAGAMKRLAKEWEAIKAGTAPAAAPGPAESIVLTGKAARRYASHADIKVPKGGSVTLAREDAQGFLDALKSGQVQGESRAALDRLGDLLEQNRALQARIKEAAAPLKPRNELASERLTAIENAQEVLRQPKPRTEPPPGTKLLSHVAYGASAGLVGLIPGVGHVLGPVVGSKVADAVAGAMGKLSSAAAESQRRLARIAASFLGKAAPVAGKAAELAPPVATKVLAALRYGEPASDERGRRVAKPEPKTLPELYKARTDEIKAQVQLAPDGTYQMKPAARARMAARLSGLGIADPIAADRLESAGAARIAWLASQMPRRPDLAGLPVGPDTYQPSDAAMRGWARKAAAAEDPYGVLERASAGAKARVVPEEIMALRALHSALLDDYVTRIIAGLSEREQRLPYAQRLSLSMLTGRPLDPAMTPAVLRELQSMFASEPGTAGGTMAPRPNPQFGSVKRSDPGTPAQRRQGIGL